MNDKLQYFGNKLMKEVRDRTIREFDLRVSGKMMDEESQRLANKMQNMNEEQRELINKIISQSIDLCIHNTLCLLEDNDDIVLLVDDISISECSDGLSGELYTEDGWIQKFSEQRYDEI